MDGEVMADTWEDLAKERGGAQSAQSAASPQHTSESDPWQSIANERDGGKPPAKAGPVHGPGVGGKMTAGEPSFQAPDPSTLPAMGKVAGGVAQLTGMGDIFRGQRLRGLHNIIEGTGETLAPMAIPAAVAAPVPMLAATGGSLAGRWLARKGAELFDASPEVEDLAGDAGGIIGGATGYSPKGRAFFRGAYEGAKAPTSINLGHGPIRISVPVPASVSGAATGAGGARLVGAPPAAGAAVGAVIPMIRGGMRAASAEPWLPADVQNPMIPNGQRLLNRGGFVMPGVQAEDTSFVRGVPAMTQPPNPSRALPPSGRVLVTPPPEDASFVRAVPGEWATKDYDANPSALERDLERSLAMRRAQIGQAPATTQQEPSTASPLKVRRRQVGR